MRNLYLLEFPGVAQSDNSAPLRYCNTPFSSINSLPPPLSPVRKITPPGQKFANNIGIVYFYLPQPNNVEREVLPRRPNSFSSLFISFYFDIINNNYQSSSLRPAHCRPVSRLC